MTKERFKEAILRTLGNDIHSDEPSDSSSTGTTTMNAGRADAQPASGTQVIAPASPDHTIIPVPSSTEAATPRTLSTVQDLLADRRRRLEIDRKEKEAAEKAERRAKAEARRQAIEAAPDSAKAKQASYAQQQRIRQQEERLERERIMREIEINKRDRREKEERRKALVKAETEGNDGAGGLVNRQISREVGEPRPTLSKVCAIQVRLLDGSTIRSIFLPDRTLRTDVRAWVDEHRQDEDTPYTFKQILTPLPNRTITISEEEESLHSLGLSPSATLVMLPVQGYTAAYAGDSGIISRSLSAGYNVVSAGADMVTGALGRVLGLGQAPPQETVTPAQPTPIISDSRARGTTNENNIRTLHLQREGGDDRHQLYNGNQVCPSFSMPILVDEVSV